MSDERFDDAIREALLADDPGAVPTRLRSRMAMIPDEAAGQTAVALSPWRDRFNRYALPMGVLAAAAIIVVVFGGIALRGQQIASVQPTVPSLAPSLVASAPPSAVSSETTSPSEQPSSQPSSTASGTPSPKPSTAPTATAPSSPAASGPIAIDPSKVIVLTDGTFALNGTMSYYRSVSDTVSYPLLGYRDLTNSENAKSVVFLENGHDIAGHAITDAGFVWIETWYTDPAVDCTNMVPCSPHGGQPVSWKLNLTTLDGKTTKLDGGVVSRLSVEGEGSTPLPPEMDAQGDRVVYAVPRTVSGQPQASRIIVRSLPDGAIVRTIDTSGYVGQVGIFGQAVIYRRAVDTTQPTDPSNAYLNVAVDDASKPVTLDGPVAQASIGDGGTGGTVRIAWVPGYGGTPSLRWVNLGETAFHTVAVGNHALTAVNPSIIGDGYAWLASVESGDGTSAMQVQVWKPGWAEAQVVPDLGAPDALISSDGKLIVSGGDVPLLRQLPEGATDLGALLAADVFGG